MKMIVFLYALAACGPRIDNIGKQCDETNVACASDQDCPLGTSVGPNALCMICTSDDDAGMPGVDGPSPACLGPTTIIVCDSDADCVDWPGTTCEQGTTFKMCVCPCTPPPQPVSCSSQLECTPYPNTTCLQNTCTCLVPSI
jgi:hypothetical protein